MIIIMQCSTQAFCVTHLNAHFEDIQRSNTHNLDMIVTISTRPKHNLTHSGRQDGWLGRTLLCNIYLVYTEDYYIK